MSEQTIQEWLRYRARSGRKAGNSLPDGLPQCRDELHREAAKYDDAADCLDTLEAENARLREVLREVEASFPSHSIDGGWGGKGDPHYAERVRSVLVCQSRAEEKE